MELTAERVRELLHYDPATGSWTWRAKTNRSTVIGAEAGTRLKHSIRIGIEGRVYYASRLAWLYVHGHWPTQNIDHINGNPFDNRLVNLRDVSQSVNLQNRHGPSSHNKAGVLGVHWAKHAKAWCAMLRANGKSRNLGLFDTKEQAHAAYLAAKRIHHVGNTL